MDNNANIVSHVRRRILVIDDNPAIHNDFRKVLVKDGPDAELAAMEANLFGETAPKPEGPAFELDSAMQGEEGLRKLLAAQSEGRPYALAFVDMRMPPGWDGVKTIEQLWAHDPDLEVVICTAYSDYSLEEIEERLGLTDKLLILKKPFDTIEVTQLALALTQKWELSRQAKIRLSELEAMVAERTENLASTLKALESSKLALERQNKILHELYEGTAGATGKDFFELAARHLAKAMDVPYAFIGEYHPRLYLVEPLVVSGRPGPLAAFPMDATAWQALGEGRVYDLTKEDKAPLFNAFGAKSLLMVPLVSPTGLRLGVLAVLNDEPIQLDAPLEKVIPIFANRVAAEIERQKSERSLRENERAMFKSQKLESLGILAGGIAHDFNNLLCGVTANASLLLRGLPQDSPMRDMLEPIVSAARNASELSNQLLAYTGQGKVMLKSLDLRELVLQMQSLLIRQVCPGGSLSLDVPAGEPVIVNADAGQIRQIIMNLVLNAHEAIQGSRGRGAIVIRLQKNHVSDNAFSDWICGEELQSGDYACLEVWDSGPGMPAEILNKIFEPFYTTKFTGRGLGLAAVLGIVRGHNGALMVESKPGEGAVFRVYLPVFGSEVAPTISLLEGRGALVLREAAPSGKRTVLLVDDEPVVRDVAEKVFTLDGIDVVTASTGEKALEIFKQQKDGIGCVVLDLTMPGLSGLETLKALRTMDPSVQVVIISGYSKEQALEGVAAMAPSAFVQKPFDPDVLLDTVNIFLEPVGFSEESGENRE